MAARARKIDYDDTGFEPGEVPEPLGPNIGMGILTTANVVIAAFLLLLVTLPVVWGDILSGFEKQVARTQLLGEVARNDPVVAAADDQLQKVDSWQQRYARHRMLHYGALVLGAVAIVLLLRSAFESYFGDLNGMMTTIALVLAFVVTAVMLWLGWGGYWGIGFLILIGTEAILLQLPPIQRFLENETFDADDD